MKIKRLIEILKTFPENYEVIYYQPFTLLPGKCEITRISIDEKTKHVLMD